MTNIISALHVFPLSAALVSQSQRQSIRLAEQGEGVGMLFDI